MKIIVWLILCLIWGTTWFFIKIGLEDLPPITFAATRFVLALVILAFVIRLQDLPPLSFAAVRFICAGLIVFVIIRWQKIPLPATRKEWKLVFITGILQFSINYALVFWSEQHISSGLAAVLQATIPVFGLLFASLQLPDEKVTGRKVAAILLGIAGIVIIFAEQLQINSWLAFAGCLAIIFGACAAAEASILIKASGGKLHPLSLVFGQMVCGILPLLIVGIWTEGSPLNFHWTPRAIFSILYLAVLGTIVAFWLYYWLLQRIESSKAMTISLVTPLVAVIVGSIALDEKLHLQTFIGGALILGSIGITILRNKNQTQIAHLTAEG